MRRMFNWLYGKTYIMVKDNGCVLFGIAIGAIAMAVLGYYGTNGFSWKTFLCMELPLYLFCTWTLWKAFELYKKTREIGKGGGQ